MTPTPTKEQMLGVVEDAVIEIGQAGTEAGLTLLVDCSKLLSGVAKSYRDDMWNNRSPKLLDLAYGVAVAWGISVIERENDTDEAI